MFNIKEVIIVQYPSVWELENHLPLQKYKMFKLKNPDFTLDNLNMHAAKTLKLRIDEHSYDFYLKNYFFKKEYFDNGTVDPIKFYKLVNAIYACDRGDEAHVYDVSVTTFEVIYEDGTKLKEVLYGGLFGSKEIEKEINNIIGYLMKLYYEEMDDVCLILPK